MDNWESIEPGIWKPEKEGDMIEGILVKVDEKSGKYESPAYHIETANGEHKTVFGSTVLNNRMSYVNPGDRLRIIFKRLEKNSKNQDVKIFEVLRQKTGVSVETEKVKD